MNFGIPGKRNAMARRWRILLPTGVLTLLHLVAVPAFGLDWGVNVHDGGSDPETMARRLAERNLKSVRMDLWGNDSVYQAKFRRAVALFNARGIKVQAVIFTENGVQGRDALGFRRREGSPLQVLSEYCFYECNLVS